MEIKEKVDKTQGVEPTNESEKTESRTMSPLYAIKQFALNVKRVKELKIVEGEDAKQLDIIFTNAMTKVIMM